MTRPHRYHYVPHSCFVSLVALLLVTGVAETAPPVLTVPGPQQVNQYQPLHFGVSATDPEGQDVQIFAMGVPFGAVYVDNRNNTGTFDWTPGRDDAGSYSVTFVADDTFGGSDTKSVAIDVLATNVPPNLGPIADRTVDPGTMAIISIWATDDDSDPLAFRADGVPSFGVFADYGNGTASIILTPPADAPGGVYPITVTVTDGKDESSLTFVVTIPGEILSNPPTLPPIEALSVEEGGSAHRDLSAEDADGDPLSWSSSLPAFASLAVLSNAGGLSTARLEVAPGFCSAGDYSASVTVSDGVSSQQRSFTIHVTDVPRTPSWSTPEPGTVVHGAVGAEVVLALAGADPDQACGGPAPVFSLHESDAGSALSLSVVATGAGTAALHAVVAGPGGEYHVTLRLADGADPARFVDRTVTIVAEDVARVAEATAWTRPKDIHLWLGSSWQRFYLEPAAGSFEPGDVDPQSIRVSAWEGAGEGSGARVLERSAVVGTDNNENAIRELRFDVAKSDLKQIFSHLTEPAEGLVTVTASLRNGEVVTARFHARVLPDKKRAIKRCGPNPLNPEAVVEIETETEGRLRVMVFDVSGRMVRVLVDEGNAPAGTRELRFDGHDDRGRALRAGRYFVRVESTRGRDATALTILP